MIKFFRKIRLELLSKNESSKYLKYALGEIILVVVGILIALQINTWNQIRINQEIKTTYILSLKKDLINQLNTIQLQMDFESEIIEYAKPILEHYYSNSKLKIDSLFFLSIEGMIARKTFIRNDPTYTVLLSSGDLELIKEIELKQEIVAYYQELARNEDIIIYNNSLYVDQVYKSAFLQIGVSLSSDFGFHSRTMELSKKQLLKMENELWIINLISHRRDLAKGNYGRMDQLYLTTEKLINSIEILLTE